METKIKITVICGWALPKEWFRQLVKNYFPEAEVRACYPKNPENEEEATEIFDSKPDWVIGSGVNGSPSLKRLKPMTWKKVLKKRLLIRS